ncbi:hypothetical protein [Paraburkholderia bannensis]|uniref:hypothetical protein n=1 Tax=Paraburkholderia bannensis TaxID=765414 RepID=UPI002AB69ACA|nr:hypothetical protein [Paraburkholderia bannensis]
MVDAASRVLRAGAWLISNGYGRLTILPYMAPSGCYWRCEFHLPGLPSETVFRYSSGSATNYLESHGGETVPEQIGPRELGLAIVKSVPLELKDAILGEATQEMLDWLHELDCVLDAGLLPSAFHEYTSDFSQWDLISLTAQEGEKRMRPQPGYVMPGAGRGSGRR